MTDTKLTEMGIAEMREITGGLYERTVVDPITGLPIIVGCTDPIIPGSRVPGSQDDYAAGF